MNKVEEIVDRTLSKGYLTQAEHDELMLLINSDGQVDDFESAQLARIFSAIEQGTLRVVDKEPHRPQRRAQAEPKHEMEERSAALQQQRNRSLRQSVEEIVASGRITRREHDRMMKQIHADGKIDEQEKQVMSLLFEALRSGSVKMEEDDESFDEAQDKLRLEEVKRQAVEQDEALERERRERVIAKEMKEAAPAASHEPPPPPRGEAKDAEDDDFSGPPPLPEAFGSRSEPPVSQSPEKGPDEAPPSVFISRAKGRREEGRTFQLETERLLDIKLKGKVWIRTGSMVAYYGAVKFTREGYAEHGITKMIKKAVTGEGTPLTKATGQGNLYCADQGKKISVIELMGHSLVVNGKNILAFEETVNWDITYLRQFAAMWVGGFFNVRLSGRGMVAITTHFDPLVLKVSPLDPVMTDANATVAWSGSLTPQFKTDIAANTLIGRVSGETMQMRFEGDGFVVIQPYEEVYVEREFGDSAEKKP